MKINLAIWDRVLRFLIGTILNIWAFAGGPWWTYFGIYLVMSSGWGYCFFYWLFKIRSFNFHEHRFQEFEKRKTRD